MPRRQRRSLSMTDEVRGWAADYKRKKGIQMPSISLQKNQYERLCSEMRDRAKLPGVEPVVEPITHFEGIKINVIAAG